MIFKIRTIYLVNPVNPVKKQNKANLLEAGGWQLKAFLLNEPNLNIYPVNPVYLVKNIFMQNKPNICVYDLKMRLTEKNKPNSLRRAYVGLRSPVRSRGIEPDYVRLNEPNLKAGSWQLEAFLPNEPNFAVNLFKTTISAKKYQKNIDL